MNLNRLTTQEHKVAIYIAQGYNNEEISCAMGISKRTVVNYITKCLERLDIPLGGASRVKLARKVWEEI